MRNRCAQKPQMTRLASSFVLIEIRAYRSKLYRWCRPIRGRIAVFAAITAMGCICLIALGMSKTGGAGQHWEQKIPYRLRCA